MPRTRKPREGSLEVWPRNRASRIYSSPRSWPDIDEPKPLAFAGYKAGMTQVVIKDTRKDSPTQNQLVSVPVTVLDTPPLFVLGARSYVETPDGLKATAEMGARESDVPTDLRDRAHFSNNRDFQDEDVDEVRLVVCTQPTRTGLGKKEPETFEVALGGNVEEGTEYAVERVGEEIEVGDVFDEGEFADAIAVTKGKGYEGPVKRYGLKIKPRKAERPRHVGSIGARGQGRVLYTAPQPGQDGFHRRTDEGKWILKAGEADEVNPDGGFKNYGLIKENCLVVKGSVPGSTKRLVVLRRSIKRDGKVQTDVRDIKTGSQQGV